MGHPVLINPREHNSTTRANFALTDDGDPGVHVDAELDLLEERRLPLVVEVRLVEAEDGRLQPRLPDGKF